MLKTQTVATIAVNPNPAVHSYSFSSLSLLKTDGEAVAPSPPSGKPLSEYRVAVWANEDAGGGRFAVSAETEATVEASVAALEAAGACVDRTARPRGFDPVEWHQCYLELVSAVYAGRISEHEFGELSRMIARAYVSDCGGGPQDLKPETIKALRLHQLNHRSWLEANEQRTAIQSAWDDFFDTSRGGFDVLLCPVSKTEAFPHDHSDAIRPFYVPGFRTLEVLPLHSL